MTPVVFTWDGETMTPQQRFNRVCSKQYVIGETYPLVPMEARSQASHAHYFAAVNEAWSNLPEDLTERFPTSEHLRKAALVKAGYADERTIVCSSKAEAQRIAAFVRPIDTYAIVHVSEATVKVFTAQSQSMRAMGKKVFQESKDKVLEILADLIGVEVKALSKHAEAA